MITFYLTTSGLRRNKSKSEYFSGRFSWEAFHKHFLSSKADLLLNRGFLEKNIHTKHPQKWRDFLLETLLAQSKLMLL